MSIAAASSNDGEFETSSPLTRRQHVGRPSRSRRSQPGRGSRSNGIMTLFVKACTTFDPISQFSDYDDVPSSFLIAPHGLTTAVQTVVITVGRVDCHTADPITDEDRELIPCCRNSSTTIKRSATKLAARALTPPRNGLVGASGAPYFWGGPWKPRGTGTAEFVCCWSEPRAPNSCTPPAAVMDIPETNRHWSPTRSRAVC